LASIIDADSHCRVLDFPSDCEINLIVFHGGWDDSIRLFCLLPTGSRCRVRVRKARGIQSENMFVDKGEILLHNRMSDSEISFLPASMLIYVICSRCVPRESGDHPYHRTLS
jgi:hypothetical protein